MLRFLLLGMALTLMACSPQTPPSAFENYKEARSTFWRKLYPSEAESLYCRTKFNTSDRRGFNVEHVFPMSWATNGLKCGKRKQCRASSQEFNRIEGDLHNLYPAREDVNRARSSFRFGDVKGEQRQFGTNCDFEVDRRARVAEPAPEVRGDVARAMFYMADRYKDQGLVIFKKQAKMLHRWHQSDPPSRHEKERNDAIEALQGNRNPFIDRPKELDKLLSSGHFY